MTLELDLHGLTELDALKTLERFIARAPKDCEQIIVIHGYYGGDALMKMVRDPNKLRSKRILRRKLTKNPGETVLILDV